MTLTMSPNERQTQKITTWKEICLNTPSKKYQGLNLIFPLCSYMCINFLIVYIAQYSSSLLERRPTKWNLFSSFLLASYFTSLGLLNQGNMILKNPYPLTFISTLTVETPRLPRAPLIPMCSSFPSSDAVTI